MTSIISRIKSNWRKTIVILLFFLVAATLVMRYEKQGLSGNTGTVMLTIKGEVSKPGSYAVKKGTSINENIYLFGGYTSRADLSKTNINGPITKDTTVTIKARSSSSTDRNDYSDLYSIPE